MSDQKRTVNITYDASKYLTMGVAYTDTLRGIIDGVHARLANEYNLEFIVSYQNTDGNILGITFPSDKDKALVALNMFEEAAGMIRKKSH